jgi:lysophospholipase L1-like esterase
VLQRLAALALGLGLIGALECGLRVVGFDPAPGQESFRFLGMESFLEDDSGSSLFVRDRVLFWRLRAGAALPEGLAQRETVNEDGFRGPALRAERRPGVARIAMLGDSSTVGVRVPWEAVYVSRLQRGLSERGVTSEVLDAGCHAYSTYQGLRLLETRVLPLKPDVVTLYFGAWNDLVPAIGAEDAEKGRRLASYDWAKEARSAASRLRLYALFVSLRDRLAAASSPSAEVVRDQYLVGFGTAEPPDGRRVPLATFRENLHAMVARARVAGAHPILLTPPFPAKSQALYPIALAYRAAVARVAAEANVTLVDAAAQFDRRAEQGEALFVDFVHPSAEGHALLAELLEDAVAAALLEPGASASR